jgi:hypothetical protein
MKLISILKQINIEELNMLTNSLFYESYNPNIYEVECIIALEAGKRSITSIISDIRAITGVTTIDITYTDENTEKGRHLIKTRIKIDPSPFTPFDQSSYDQILSDIKKLPNVIGAKFSSEPTIVENLKLKNLIKEIIQESKRDRCLRIADRKFDKPSAYKSGAVVRCRKGKIWKGIKEGKKQLNIQDLAYIKINGLLEKGIEYGLAHFKAFIKSKYKWNKTEDKNEFFNFIENLKGEIEIKRVPLERIFRSQEEKDYKNESSKSEAQEFQKILNNKKNIKDHRKEDFYPIVVNKRDNKIIDGNHRHYALSAIKSPYAVVLYVDVPEKYLKEGEQLTEKQKETLRTWFKRKGAPGKTGGWVDCNSPIHKDGKITGYKPCGRQKGEVRSKYPSCRPTPSKCKDPGKGKKWGKTK